MSAMVVIIRIIPAIMTYLLIRVASLIHPGSLVRHPFCIAVLRVHLLVAPTINICTTLNIHFFFVIVLSPSTPVSKEMIKLSLFKVQSSV